MGKFGLFDWAIAQSRQGIFYDPQQWRIDVPVWCALLGRLEQKVAKMPVKEMKDIIATLDRSAFRSAYPEILNVLIQKAQVLGLDIIAVDLEYIQKRSVVAFKITNKNVN